MAAVCPGCGGASANPLLCAACGRLLEPAGPVDPFAVFGLEPAFDVDRKALRKELLRLQRALHPDFHGGADSATRALAERDTAELNAAHEVLDGDARRADWLVRSRGGPDENQERQMPQAFLMEVMEWNEVLEEARAAAPGSAERDAALALREPLEAERAERLRAVARLLTPVPEPGSPRLAEARRELNAVRYVDRALGQVEELRLQRTP